ncbi:hypothetical protein F5888DRAFT_1635838 [Russula emetica]|nr:hypothetical protein F5888DRAFT_1635838 [Russula emetica]
MTQNTPPNEETTPTENKPESTIEGKKAKRKRQEMRNADDKKEAETAAPTKALRNERRKSARSAPSTLTLRSQIDATYTTSPATRKDPPMFPTNTTPQQSSNPTTPTDIFRSGTLSLPPPREDDGERESHDTSHTSKEQRTQRTIKVRMAEVEEEDESETMNRTSPWNPLTKYTEHEMRDVHYNHPMAALRNIDLDTIGKWEEIQSGKLLAQPFGMYATKVENHSTLKALIFAAVFEITNEADISVCAPRRSHTAERNPNSFLIHNLTEKQRQTLLIRGIWSSTGITFRVIPLEPACPNFLFSIKGFTTLNTPTVHKTVKEVWDDAATEAFLQGICNHIPEKDRTEANLALRSFIQSMWVTILETRNRGNTLAPTFRVYAIGGAINEDRTWCQLRSYLAARDYVIPFEDPGINIIPKTECSLCHGADHPRGLCQFPTIRGWNGPTCREDPPLIDPNTSKSSEPTFSRDRNRARLGRN